MKKKLLFLGLAAMSASTVALTSCGGGSVEGAGEAFQVLDTSVLKDKDNPVEISFWHSFGHNITEELDELIENAEKDLAEKGYYIKVNVVAKGGGYDNLRSQVNLGTKSNSIPTLILGYPDHFADYINNDILLPLDDYVYSTDEAIKLEGVTKESNDFIDSYWAENQMLINGSTKVAGIPFNKSTEIMTYNSNIVDPILEAKGWLSADGKWENPTWDQVFEVSQYILDNKDNISYKYNNVDYKLDLSSSKYPVFVDSMANYFITTSRQWGGEGKYTRLESDGTGVVTAYNDTNKTVQEYFLDKATKKLFQFPDKVNQSYGSNLLINLQTAITIGSTAGIKNNSSQKYELKATSIPQKEYGANANNAVIQQGTNLAILSKNSNNKTRLAAWMLIKYLTSTAATEEFSMETGYLPVRKSARATETYKAFLDDEDDVFTGTVAKAVNAAFSQTSYFYTDPAFKSSSIVRDRVDTLVKDLFIYDKGYDTAMNSFYSELEKLGIKTQK